MKKILFVSYLLLISVSHFLQGVEPEIKSVVVYRQGAKVTSVAQVSLASGNNEVIIEKLTPQLNPNSLQVSVEGQAMLLSATTRINYLNQQLPEKTKMLNDSLTLIWDRITWLSNEQNIYQGEENMIIANQKIVNEKVNITTDELSKLASFYRSRLMDCRKKTFDNSIELRKLNEKKSLIEKQLSDLQYMTNQQTSEIVLNISATQASKATVYFSYYCPNAGWAPLYDIRCESTEKPLNLLYKANVYQTTGYDWSHVNLVISTGNPAVSNDRPILNPWYIDFYQEAYYGSYGGGAKKRIAAPATYNMMTADEEDLREEVAAYEAPPEIPYDVTLSSSQMASEYKIEVKQDIPSDGKVHLVPISKFELPAAFTYHTVPKLDQHAFLLARVGDYGQFNLLPGQANIFFEGMYVGQSYLNPEIASDSLMISLGRDDKINVQYHILKDVASKQMIGLNRKEVKGYEIIIKNNKSTPISIEILDQVPIAQNKDIVVEIEDQGGASYNTDFGRLLWIADIKPAETKKTRFVYSVKYPKDKTVSGF